MLGCGPQLCALCCRARAEKKPSLEHMFTDVYDVPPLRLRRQKEEVQAMVAKYPEHFPTASHE